jgi:hypothetical protein
MCPVCIATTAAILAGSTAGTGGIAAFFARWFRRGK